MGRSIAAVLIMGVVTLTLTYLCFGGYYYFPPGTSGDFTFFVDGHAKKQMPSLLATSGHPAGLKIRVSSKYETVVITSIVVAYDDGDKAVLIAKEQAPMKQKIEAQWATTAGMTSVVSWAEFDITSAITKMADFRVSGDGYFQTEAEKSPFVFSVKMRPERIISPFYDPQEEAIRALQKEISDAMKGFRIVH